MFSNVEKLEKFPQIVVKISSKSLFCSWKSNSISIELRTMVVQSERIFRLGTMASNNLQSLELYPFDEKEIEFGGKRRKKKEKKKKKRKRGHGDDRREADLVETSFRLDVGVKKSS